MFPHESDYNGIEHSKNNLNNARIKKIRENFNKLKNRFLKPKIKKIRKLCKIENKKKISKSKTKEIDKILLN